VSPIHFSGCWQTGPLGRILWVSYMMLCILETFILSLTVYKGLVHYRFNKPESNLGLAIYQDGVIYYFYSVAASCLNIMFILLEIPGISMIEPQRVLHSVVTSHLLLNMRRAAHEDQVKWMPNMCSTCEPTNTERFINASVPGFNVHGSIMVCNGPGVRGSDSTESCGLHSRRPAYFHATGHFLDSNASPQTD